ncbi:ergothioneine biosynthesis protein EgtC [Mangrovihabitans endophyticus]|uniref:Gamma-glutamyl-hercynylcysteine sulfoxide hydrolase n=1 Tax=Mangrovihabitans endophyticus TaxID=1751298 RepID=A0A8J3C931_9ACTN|nr:ergothioneine biosynthesis protein EgtC [Mangrovihabitans endophyticus]GGL20590.1 gamma-glutamyl-hercynylcysteine sulfoxide hydrolase [Mangrovihabitans endophyticus]
MCRHLAYLGPAVPLSELLFDPPHALVRQSWAPADMRGGGTVNADGFGVAWYPPDAPTPVRYRRTVPMWTDTTLPELARATTAGAVLAAVRSGTVGMPVVETAAAPFVDGSWSFSHNGVVRGWPGSLAKLAGRLPVTDLLTLDAPTDAALLWALTRDRLRAGVDPAEAVADVVTEVERAAPGSRLNLLLTDGTRLVATTVGHALSVRRGTDAVLVSSEPLDPDPMWQAVPDRRLLVATPSALDLVPLGRP